jgi:hypothetical protein
MTRVCGCRRRIHTAEWQNRRFVPIILAAVSGTAIDAGTAADNVGERHGARRVVLLLLLLLLNIPERLLILELRRRGSGRQLETRRRMAVLIEWLCLERMRVLVVHLIALRTAQSFRLVCIVRIIVAIATVVVVIRGQRNRWRGAAIRFRGRRGRG